MTEQRLIFVTGAARSGKSRYAEDLASSLAGDEPVLYVATAEAGDDEMRWRIEEHRARRPRYWQVLEARRGVAPRLPGPGAAKVVLLDCLSILVSNILLDAAADPNDVDPEVEREATRAVYEEIDALVSWHGKGSSNLVVVSNEVGWSVVPPHRMGRVYRDLLGSANQRIAGYATDAYLFVAGIPIPLKGEGRCPGSGYGNTD